jgi:hypothetical protein
MGLGMQLSALVEQCPDVDLLLDGSFGAHHHPRETKLLGRPLIAALASHFDDGRDLALALDECNYLLDGESLFGGQSRSTT